MNTPSANDVLEKLGLQTKMTARDYMFPVLGSFGIGLLVGAGIVAVSVPSLRNQLRDRLRRGASKVRNMGEHARDELEGAAEQIKEKAHGGNGRSQPGEDFQAMTREQLMEHAKSMHVQTRANMSKTDLIDAISA